MNDAAISIERYTRAFEEQLVGPADERAVAAAELSGHLHDAAEAGELEATMARLGPPEAAAAAFNRENARPLAPIGDRLMAAAVDNLPLIAVTVALIAQSVMDGAGRVIASFPPLVYVQFGGFCVAPVPFSPCGVYGGGWLYAAGVSLALLWSIVGLGLLESRSGETPGKRLLGLRVVSEAGVRIRPHAGIIRRLSFIAGPFAWLDWIPTLWGDRRRILDRVSAVRVVIVGRGGEPARMEDHEDG